MKINPAVATMTAFNKSDYVDSYSLKEGSYSGFIVLGVLILVTLALVWLFINKKLKVKMLIQKVFQSQCAYCKKILLRKEGIRKKVNFEGTMMKRKIAFCDQNHLDAYLRKWGEPLGCCANCNNASSKKYSFEWWIFWIRAVALLLFAAWFILEVL